MKIIDTYFHGHEQEAFMRKYREEITDIYTLVESMIISEFKLKLSKELGRRNGQLLYSPTRMNKAIAEKLLELGWSIGRDNRVSVETELARKNGKHIGYREMDGIKGDLGLEVQFGKYAFMGYDILGKMPIFSKRGVIKAGIELVPAKEIASKMSTGVSYYEQITSDLFERGISNLDVPVLVMAIGFKELPILIPPTRTLIGES